MGEVLSMTASSSMTAVEVREALMGKWSPAEYVHVNEAPQDAARQGRKIDVLVLSMWASRGHELDAVEIKVSYSDWKRELENAAKADWWWTHAHRFWIAVPEKLAERIRPELPTGWGLLSCIPDAVTVLVKAEKHEAEPLPWQATVGIIRAACDAGPNALMRAEARGRERGFKEGQERSHTQVMTENLRAELDRMRESVQAFEAASGISIIDRWTVPPGKAERMGRIVKLLTGPYGETLVEQLVSDLDRSVRSLSQARDDLATALEPQPEAAERLQTAAPREAS